MKNQTGKHPTPKEGEQHLAPQHRVHVDICSTIVWTSAHTFIKCCSTDIENRAEAKFGTSLKQSLFD